MSASGETSTREGAPVRVRIAPSPTGDPHVGTAYIGLFNFAFARKHGGQFILRIEDTDRARSTAGSEQAILEALRWVGLEWDEGPDVGGPAGPYRQSERLDIYAEAVDELLASRAAYRCFCTRERLDALREEQKAEQKRRKQAGDSTTVRLGYDGRCRELDPAEANERAQAGEEHVVRLAVPRDGTTEFMDALAGSEISIENAQIDDQVLMKSDGYPTYHLANVVDDHYMAISHVIRGEEWINSTPKHVLLYRAFGWEMPEFYHLGLLRNADKSKLSKRKNPVSVFHYRDLGYLPETFTNFLANLGYSFGDDVERFTLEQWIENFDWSHVSRGGPVFDSKKLDAFSGDDIRALAPEVLYDRIVDRVLPRDRMMALLAEAQPRIERLDDFIPYVSCFFGASLDYSQVLDLFRVKNRSRKEVLGILKDYLDEIETDAAARTFEVGGLEAFSREFCSRKQWKPKELFPLLRLAATARKATPPLFTTLHLCGKDRFRMRVRDVMAALKAGPNW